MQMLLKNTKTGHSEVIWLTCAGADGGQVRVKICAVLVDPHILTCCLYLRHLRGSDPPTQTLLNLKLHVPPIWFTFTCVGGPAGWKVPYTMTCFISSVCRPPVFSLIWFPVRLWDHLQFCSARAWTYTKKVEKKVYIQKGEYLGYKSNAWKEMPKCKYMQGNLNIWGCEIKTWIYERELKYIKQNL